MLPGADKLLVPVKRSPISETFHPDRMFSRIGMGGYAEFWLKNPQEYDEKIAWMAESRGKHLDLNDFIDQLDFRYCVMWKILIVNVDFPGMAKNLCF